MIIELLKPVKCELGIIPAGTIFWARRAGVVKDSDGQSRQEHSISVIEYQELLLVLHDHDGTLYQECGCHIDNYRRNNDGSLTLKAAA